MSISIRERSISELLSRSSESRFAFPRAFDALSMATQKINEFESKSVQCDMSEIFKIHSDALNLIKEVDLYGLATASIELKTILKSLSDEFGSDCSCKRLYRVVND